jgi:heptosyltransferase I
MKVLIIKASALGDIINSLPVLDYLHKVSPGIEIDWVVEEPYRKILEGNPLLGRIFSVRTKVWRKKPFAMETFREIKALKSALREQTYDFVFDIQGNLKSGLICWLTECKQIFGFARQDLQESVNAFFTNRQIPQRIQDRHVTEKYLRLISVPFGRSFEGMELKSTIATSPKDDAEAEALLSTVGDGLVFLFHCGTTWQTKFWSDTGWIELGRSIISHFADATILFSWGNESERIKAAEIARSIGLGTRILDHYSLKGLCALMKKVDLVVGADTGPVHLAAAVGTPTVSFYRASDGSGSGPRGKNNVIVQSPLECTRCFRTTCDKDEDCRTSITPEMIFKGCRLLLEGQGS